MTLRTARQGMRLMPRLFGYAPRDCAICGYHGRFHAEIHFPDIFTFDAVCPRCGSLPRNRLLRLATRDKPLLPAGGSLLHFAPEDCVKRFVAQEVAEYRTADLFAQPVDLVLNIEAIDQPDARWDAIICSHVLEHVDHRKALAELYRILKPGGRLLALFPVVDGWDRDYENAAVRSEHDRGLHFGKENHLRRFGASVDSDFKAVGFSLQRYAPVGPELVQYGLIPGETLFIATKPA